MNPLHTAEMSYAAAPVRPSFEATAGAVAGQLRSGVVVATTTVSTTGSPDDLSACSPAPTARSEVAVPGAATCLCRMPVRETIHSSVVSSVAASSPLDNTRGGRQLPIPSSTAARFTQRPSDNGARRGTDRCGERSWWDSSCIGPRYPSVVPVQPSVPGRADGRLTVG